MLSQMRLLPEMLATLLTGVRFGPFNFKFILVKLFLSKFQISVIFPKKRLFPTQSSIETQKKFDDFPEKYRFSE